MIQLPKQAGEKTKGLEIVDNLIVKTEYELRKTQRELSEEELLFAVEKATTEKAEAEQALADFYALQQQLTAQE